MLAGRPVMAQKLIVTERLDDLQARARTDSNDAAAHYNLAMGLWARNDWADADRELRTAINIESTFAQAYLALGLVRDRDEGYWAAIWRATRREGVRDTLLARSRLVARAFLVDPFVDVRIMAGVRTRYGGGGVASAFDRLTQGQYEAAYQGFDREVVHVAARQGADAVAGGLLFYRALSAERSGHDSVALADFFVLLDRADKRAASDTIQVAPLAANEYRYALAALHQRAGRGEEAVQWYQSVLEHDVSNYMAHVQLARIYEAARNWTRALEERQRALDVNPDDASLLLDLGVTQGKAGKLAEAAETLRRATTTNPRDTRALYWLGVAELQLHERDQAKSAFSRFVALAPSRYDRQIATARQRLAELQ